MPIYAISGGDPQLGVVADAWTTLAQYWPALVYSDSPVMTALACALDSITQLVTLLLVPRMLARNTAEESILVGWSLGGSIVHMLASTLRSSGMSVRSLVLLEARTMAPRPMRRQV